MPAVVRGLVLGFLVLVSAPALSEEEVTSATYNKCIDKAGGVTAGIVDCSSAELQRQDKKLNEVYQRLVAKASDAQKAKLKDAQRAWLAYRDTTCELVHTFGSGGTIDSISASGCAVDVLARRVKFLEGLLDQ